jgi:hypothetical protein
MLRISVQLVPGGDERRVRELARADLANVSLLDDVSDYRIAACEGFNPLSDHLPWIQVGAARRHFRRQSVWRLVERAAAWAAERADETS